MSIHKSAVCLLVGCIGLCGACSHVGGDREVEESVGGSCYSGPLEIRVVNPDSTPAAHVPLGCGFFLYCTTEPSKEEAKSPPPLYWKTPRAGADGVFRKDRWRECMLPTYFYAVDEARGLAALEVCTKKEELIPSHTLHLRPARWLTGRVQVAESHGDASNKSLFWIQVYPGRRVTDRELRTVCGNGRFRFLLPPGEYVLNCKREGMTSRIIPVQLAAGETPYDLGSILLADESESPR